MLDAASYPALWAIFAKTGIRPEWLLPVLQSESGLNPGAPNSAGYPYYGINQISGSYLQKRGISPADYLTWPASQQLLQVVLPYMASQVAAFGPLRSGTRVYQSNFLPASLKTATELSSVLATRPAGGCPAGITSNVYCANAVFDWQKKGTITVGDLAHFVSKSVPAVKGAIAQAYAVAPAGVGGVTDPVYGTDLSSSSPVWQKALIAAASLTVAGAVAVVVYDVVHHRPVFHALRS